MTSIRIRRSRLSTLAILSIFATCVASSASAGPLATTNRALLDGFGPDAGRWRGSATVTGALAGHTVDAVVDWAAFAPGRFAQYLADEGIAQPDPSAANEVTYAYQIVEILAASPGISVMSVRLDGTDSRGSVSAPAFVPTGGANEKNRSGGGDGGTQMTWNYTGGSLLLPGDTTGIMVFTSEFAPQLDRLIAQSGLAGGNASPLVASISDRIFTHEIPEPASSALFMLAVVGTLMTHRRAR